MIPHSPSQPIAFADQGRTVVIIASGPSAGASDLGLCAGWPVLVVNDAWRLYPSAVALYAADRQWWQHHIDDVRKGFRGALWTQDRHAAAVYKLNQISGRFLDGLSRNPAEIFFNGNSGAQAMGLAFHWGARRLVLVGFDMREIKGKSHFFGKHPDQLRESPELYPSFIARMAKLSADLAVERVSVINTSKRSALPYWPKMDLKEALSRCISS